MILKRVELGELCTIEKGLTGITKAIPGDYPLVVTSEERKTHNEYQFDTEAVLVPLVSSSGHGKKDLKRIHYHSGKFALGSILCAIIPKNKNILNAEYLYRYLDLNKENELVSRMKGMANVTLPMKEISTIEIPLLPIKDQIKFVQSYKKTSNSSSLISTELDHQLDLIKQLRQSFLREAMQGKHTEEWRKQNPNTEPASALLQKIKKEKDKLIKEGKLKKQKPLPPIKGDEIPFQIPETWAWTRLGHVYDSASGGTPDRSNSSYWKGTISWLKSGELNDSTKILSSEEKITEFGLKKSSARIFKEGTLLIALYGATAGKLGVLGVESATNQAICGFLGSPLMNTKYLLYFLLNWRSKIIDDSWGQAQPNISQAYLKNFLFTLIPIAEQNQIVNKLNSLMKYCDDLESSIKKSKEQNKKLLQVVLKEALSGGIE